MSKTPGPSAAPARGDAEAALEAPLTVDFASGETAEVPEGWCSERGGRMAAEFCQGVNHGSITDTRLMAALQPKKTYWRAFRLLGSADFLLETDSAAEAVALRDKLLLPNRGIRQEPARGHPEVVWNTLGHPTRGGMQGQVSAFGVLECLKQANLAGNDVGDWFSLATNLQMPGGAWQAPFVLPRIPKSKILIHDVRSVQVTVHLYASRLLFYLIADSALARLLAPLEPVGPTVPFHASRASGTFCFSKPPAASSDDFSIAGILSEAVDQGYPSASQPEGIALQMKEYQLQTLQFLLDQEALPRGLNGCFWEARSFEPFVQPLTDGPPVIAPSKVGSKRALVTRDDATNDSSYFVSEALGELRLECPPLVRGGLLCEEMGLGKTLEIVALIKASQSDKVQLNRLQSLTPVRHKPWVRAASAATLVVVPETLVEQWLTEIEKSCTPDSRLSVYLHVPDDLMHSPTEEEEEKCWAAFVGHDVVLTTFSVVERVKARTGRAGVGKCLQAIHWRRVVIDEMQEIRSSTTKVAQSCEALSSATRWMVSGTPLFNSVNDLNGLLNFLQIWPFSLSDKLDGFWGTRLGEPLRHLDKDALKLLHHLLNNIMIRHVKAQKFIVGSLAGQSILCLPKARKEYVALEFQSFAERAAYAHLESTYAQRALDKERGAVQTLSGNAWVSRPTVILQDVLRRFCISPSLITGGSGVVGDAGTTPLSDLQRLHRGLISTLPDANGGHSGGLLGASLGGNSGFKHPPKVAANNLRDAFLAQSGKSVTHSASAKTEQAAHHELTAQSVAEETEKIAALRATLAASKAKSQVDSLPMRRWQYALVCITSGRAVALDLLKGASLAQCNAQSPLLLRRAVRFLAHVKHLSTTESAVAALEAKYHSMSNEDLLDFMGLEYELTTEEVEIGEGMAEDRDCLMFTPAADGPLPYSAPRMPGESVKSSADDVDDKYLVSEGDDEVGDDDESKVEDYNEDEDDSGSLSEKEKAKASADKEPVPVNFLRHEAFWRGRIIRYLQSQDAELQQAKEAVRVARRSLACLSHPGMHSISVRTACKSLPEEQFDLEARFYFFDEAKQGVFRQWCAISGRPDFSLECDLCSVRFLDGDVQVVDAIHDLRIQTRESLLRMALEAKPASEVTLKDALGALRWGKEKLVEVEAKVASAGIVNAEELLTAMLRRDEASTLLIAAKDESLMLGNSNLSKTRREELMKLLKERADRVIEMLLQKAECDVKKRMQADAAKVLQDIMAMEPSSYSSSSARSVVFRHATMRPEVWDRFWAKAVHGRESLARALELKLNLHPAVLVESADDRAGFQAAWTKRLQQRSERKRGVLVSIRELVVDDLCVARLFRFGAWAWWHAVVKSVNNAWKDGFVGSSRLLVRLPNGEEHWLAAHDVGLPPQLEKKFDEPKELEKRQKTLLDPAMGYCVFPDATVRRRFCPSAVDVAKDLYKRLHELKLAVASATVELPNREAFLALLVKNLSGGSKAEGVFENQGFKGLSWFSEPGSTAEPPACGVCLENFARNGDGSFHPLPVITKCMHVFCHQCLMTAHSVAPAGADKIRCPLCRGDVHGGDLRLVDAPVVRKELAFTSVAKEGQGEGTTTTTTTATTTTTTTTTTTSLSDYRPQWCKALSEEQVMEQFNQLPPGIENWDFQDPRFFALSKELRTYLRASVGLSTIGVGKRVDCPFQGTKFRRVVKDIVLLEGKVVVFSQFTDAVSALSYELKKAGVGCVILSRGMRVRQLSDSVRLFNSDPHCKVLVMHASTSAAGLTLTVAKSVILLEPFTSAGQEAQSMSRVHRIGQTGEVLTRTYYMRGTVEERILAFRGVHQNVPNSANGEPGDLTVLAGDPSKSVSKVSLEFSAFSLGLEEKKGDMFVKQDDSRQDSEQGDATSVSSKSENASERRRKRPRARRTSSLGLDEEETGEVLVQRAGSRQRSVVGDDVFESETLSTMPARIPRRPVEPRRNARRNKPFFVPRPKKLSLIPNAARRRASSPQASEDSASSEGTSTGVEGDDFGADSD